MSFPDDDEQEPELKHKIEVFQPETTLDGAEDEGSSGEDQDDDAFVGFADEDEGDEVEQTPLVKRLREQNRQLSRQLHSQSKQASPANDDPEPQIGDEPGDIEEFGYDGDRYRDAWRKHNEAVKAHADWKLRQDERKRAGEQAAQDRQRQVEMQKNALGIADFDQRAQVVKDRLSETQVAILLEGADNAAALIAALGKSDVKLDQLASETNLTKFAAMIGRLERDVKMGKRRPPEPERRVRSGNASVAGIDKELEALEREAARTGDRSKVVQYKRSQRAA